MVNGSVLIMVMNFGSALRWMVFMVVTNQPYTWHHGLGSPRVWFQVTSGSDLRNPDSTALHQWHPVSEGLIQHNTSPCMPWASMECLNQVKVLVFLVRFLDLDVWDQLRSVVLCWSTDPWGPIPPAVCFRRGHNRFSHWIIVCIQAWGGVIPYWHGTSHVPKLTTINHLIWYYYHCNTWPFNTCSLLSPLHLSAYIFCQWTYFISKLCYFLSYQRQIVSLEEEADNPTFSENWKTSGEVESKQLPLKSYSIFTSHSTKMRQVTLLSANSEPLYPH